MLVIKYGDTAMYVNVLQCNAVHAVICDVTAAETEDFSEHRNAIVQPGPAGLSQLQGTDFTPSIYRGDTGLKTIEGYQYLAALSEGTITDSTPGSAVNHHTPSVEEGTILSSVSSYRSIAERPPGLCLICVYMIWLTYLYSGISCFLVLVSCLHYV